MSLARALALVLLASAASSQEPEAKYYKTEYFPPPPDTAIEVGGLGWLLGDRLVVSTRGGQVWIVDGALGVPAAARWSLFAEGLDEGLGLAVEDGVVFVLQRGELSRLVDKDGDGRCERIERISAGWGLTENYHEFAYGLPCDAEGRFYVTLNLGFLDQSWWLGRSLDRWRGWALRIAKDGTVEPLATGFRSPDGVALSPDGDLFVTDNQGDWMPVCGVFHVRKGRFYSHPGGLRWLSPKAVPPDDLVPPKVERTPPAVWMPYGLSRSTGNLVWDTSGGKFGPFAGQCFAAELSNGLVARLLLEKVRGEWQGAALAFRRDVGSAHRLTFGPDGSLFCGLTNRGWGGAGKAQGITRIRPTGKVPMEVARCTLVDGGFDLAFTLPLARKIERGQVTLALYDYVWWWKYGSPEMNLREIPFTLEQDAKVLRVRSKAIEPGYCARIVMRSVVGEGDVPLLHGEVDYTINQMPSGPPCQKQIAVEVAPPKTRAEEAKLWTRLLEAKQLAAFSKHEGWSRVDSPGIAGDATVLVPKASREPQPGALLGAAGAAPLVTNSVHGDVRIRLEFMLPRNGRAELVLAGRYGIVLADTIGSATGPESCGAITAGPRSVAPLRQVYERAGEWQTLDVWFEGPRFAADRTRVKKARFVRVELNHHDDINQGKTTVDPATWTIHENVEVEAEGENDQGPIELRTQGAIAIRRFDVRGG